MVKEGGVLVGRLKESAYGAINAPLVPVAPVGLAKGRGGAEGGMGAAESSGTPRDWSR